MVLLKRSKMGTVRWGHGYGMRTIYSTIRIPVSFPYRIDPTHIPYPYHACTVSAPTVPYPNTQLNPLAKLLHTPHYKFNKIYSFHYFIK